MSDEDKLAFQRVIGDFFGLVSGTEEKIDMEIQSGFDALKQLGIISPVSVIDATTEALLDEHSTRAERVLRRSAKIWAGNGNYA